MLKITVDSVAIATYNAFIDSELVRINPRIRGNKIMLTITLNKKDFAHKDFIVDFLENEIRDLALSIDYKIVEGEGASVDYPHDEIFASKVFSVLNRAIDTLNGNIYHD